MKLYDEVKADADDDGDGDGGGGSADGRSTK